MKLDLGVIARIEESLPSLAGAMPQFPDHDAAGSGLNGEVDIKSAFIKGLPSMAVKIASGFTRILIGDCLPRAADACYQCRDRLSTGGAAG